MREELWQQGQEQGRRNREVSWCELGTAKVSRSRPNSAEETRCCLSQLGFPSQGCSCLLLSKPVQGLVTTSLLFFS